MQRTSHSFTFVGSFPGKLPAPSLPELAFAGRSNVGKSSAINTLLGARKAARVSKTPGRTQAVNLIEVDRRVLFADLPGYGYAKVPEHVQEAWGPMIEGYLGTRQTLRGTVVFVDSRHDAQKLDRQMVDGLHEAGIPFCVVATKIDKLKRSQRGRNLRALRDGLGAPPVAFSSQTGEGLEAVWAWIDVRAASPLLPDR